jgi:hypothetical protein
VSNSEADGYVQGTPGQRAFTLTVPASAHRQATLRRC